jgi:hypothetical protein
LETKSFDTTTTTTITKRKRKRKRKRNLETKLLEVRHMSRPNFFYIGLPNSIPKPIFSYMCSFPLHMNWGQHENQNPQG